MPALIRAEAVSKKFCRSFRRSLAYGVVDVLADFGVGRTAHDRLRPSEFWAVSDVTFSLERGQCLGLVGKNGAGKTSLLRMLNGLIRPDRGVITMQGNVGAMISLGAGVKDVLTGRENIHCMAALRGLSRRETLRRIDEIIDFSELRDAIDAPIQSYSSGMRVRLNFAIASAMQPDILLLDEVMAVGDAAFRDKCYHRISQLRRSAAVIFVSHNMEQIARTSSCVMVMDKGSAVFMGEVDDGIARYDSLNSGLSDGSESFESLHPPVIGFDWRPLPQELKSGDSLSVVFGIECSELLERYRVKVVIYNSKGAFAADGIVHFDNLSNALRPGSNVVRIEVNSIPLRNGSYNVSLNVLDELGGLVVWAHQTQRITVTSAYGGAVADCQLQLTATSATQCGAIEVVQ